MATINASLDRNMFFPQHGLLGVRAEVFVYLQLVSVH